MGGINKYARLFLPRALIWLLIYTMFTSDIFVGISREQPKRTIRLQNTRTTARYTERGRPTKRAAYYLLISRTRDGRFKKSYLKKQTNEQKALFLSRTREKKLKHVTTTKPDRRRRRRRFFHSTEPSLEEEKERKR